MNIHVRAVVCAVGIAAAAGAYAAQQPMVDASWQRHELDFTYTGFTSKYSCEGLEQKLKLLLKLAGARPDGDVRVVCTSAIGGPQLNSTVLLKFNTLAPVAGDKAAITAAWKDISWHAGSPRGLEAGDCELVDDFARRILPLFTTRGVENRMTCTPHDVDPAGFDLAFTVLAPASLH